jgi:hypothetical protein
MLYNETALYDQPNASYVGDLYIYVDGIENPIIVNGVSFFFVLNQDYSNFTTIEVISVNSQVEGLIIIEAYESQVSALVNAEVIGIIGQTQITISG